MHVVQQGPRQRLQRNLAERVVEGGVACCFDFAGSCLLACRLCVGVLMCSVCCLQVARLHVLLKEGIASGEVQPLPWTVFSRSQGRGRLSLPCQRCVSPLKPFHTLLSGPPSVRSVAVVEISAINDWDDCWERAGAAKKTPKAA